MAGTKAVDILLVDDDEVDIMAIKRGFKKHRIANRVVEANDGAEALEILRGESNNKQIVPPYIVLLDINMPRMDGIEFLENLRADAELKQAVVFVLTTSGEDRDKTAAYEKNVAGYIVKRNVGNEFLSFVEMLGAYWKIVELPA
jgi:CheY-like chemotaxis protein